MIDKDDFQSLLSENQTALGRLSSRHNLNRVLEIEIGSRYKDLDSAMAARKYVIDKYGKPKGVLFRVVSRKYSEDEKVIDLAFGIDAVPNAELLTKYEMMLQDAADHFGGERPGWEIAPS